MISQLLFLEGSPIPTTLLFPCRGDIFLQLRSLEFLICLSFLLPWGHDLSEVNLFIIPSAAHYLQD